MFKYPYDLRLKAVKLAKKTSQDVLWGLVEREKVQSDLEDLIEENLGETKIDDIGLTKSSPIVSRWIYKQKKILDNL